MTKVNSSLRTEGLGLFLLSLYLFSLLDYPWWYFLVFFLIPDLSMLAYLMDTRTGARIYNLFHHQGIAIFLYLAGIYFTSPVLQFSGLIMLGHSSLDRVFGYGLKYDDNFKNTHLGMLK